MIYNEYDKLKTVMIGQAFSSEIMFDLYGESDHSKYHGKINDETNEDLDVLEKSRYHLTELAKSIQAAKKCIPKKELLPPSTDILSASELIKQNKVDPQIKIWLQKNIYEH